MQNLNSVVPLKTEYGRRRTPVVDFLREHKSKELIGKRVFYRGYRCPGYGVVMSSIDLTSPDVGVIFDEENKEHYHSLNGKCENNRGYLCSPYLLEIVE